MDSSGGTGNEEGGIRSFECLANSRVKLLLLTADGELILSLEYKVEALDPRKILPEK